LLARAFLHVRQGALRITRFDFGLFGGDDFGEDVALSGWLGHILLVLMVLIVLVCKRRIH